MTRHIVWTDSPTEDSIEAGVDLSAYARLASPAFTGTPTAPTPTLGNDSTRIATTEFVVDAIAALNLSTYATDSEVATLLASYLTITSAASTYLTQLAAATTYAPITAIDHDATGGAGNYHLISRGFNSQNTINQGAAVCSGVTNLGAGATGAGNHAAYNGVPAVGAGVGSAVQQANWIADNVAGIVQTILSVYGAYDQVCNGTGSSVICAPHSMVRTSVTGHNNIWGGSTSLISGTSGRSTILGSTQGCIHNGSFHVIAASQNVSMSGGTFNAMVGCNGTITTASRSFHVAATSQTLSGTAGLTVGEVTGSGTYYAAIGQAITHSGSYGLTVGTTNTNSHNGAVVFGDNCKSVASYAIHVAPGQRKTFSGDTQTVTIVRGDTSTAAVKSLELFPTSATWVGGGMLEIVLAGKVRGSNLGVVFKREYMWWYNGPTDTIALTDATETSQANLYRDPLHDTSGATWTVGNNGKMRCAGNGSSFRIVTPSWTAGPANIDWTATARVTFTREA
jgi:hypothetical protein